MPEKNKNHPTVDDATEDFIITTNGKELQKQENEKEELSVDELAEKWLIQSMKTYEYDKKQSSVFLNERGTYFNPTIDEVLQLAEGAQDDLQKILRINSIISKYANIDDIIGMVVSAITTNLNDEFRLSYKNVDGRNKSLKSKKAREIIDNFNEEVGLKRLIRESIPRTYLEGTLMMYLRKNDYSWTIDQYPLGVGLVSSYKVGSEPVLLLDINELRNRLQKVMPKTRGGKHLFYKDIETEVKDNYPPEVYESFKNKDQFAKLDIRYSGVVRIGNLGRKYGVSPILRSIPSLIALETFLKSDMLNAKARAKKMIVSLLNPILLGKEGKLNPLSQQAFSHKELIEALKNQNPVFTAPAFIQDIKAIEFKGDMVGKDTIYFYLHKVISSLGMGFSTVDSGAGAVTSANISLGQLMRTINSIGSEYEDVIEKFYRIVLEDEGISPEYAPKIQIIDSEAMEFDLRARLVDLVYSKMNCSLKTAWEILNIDYDEEVYRRKSEEDEGISSIFKPRQTSYTSGGGDIKETGRPKGEENDKQVYDENYNTIRE